MIYMPGNCKKLQLTPMISMTETKMSENTTIISNENVKISIREALEARNNMKRSMFYNAVMAHMLLYFNF